ncbi:hypothetical protein [Nocardioides koreensis]|uniref:hypothetical protein n=1 Tax=Nocardioides koreensis TaxID=433651 RepID=UPI0031DA6374
MAFIVLGVLVAACVPLGSSGVRSVAEQFRAPPDAAPLEERATPRRLLCLGGSPCPSLFKSWNLPSRIDRTAFEGLMTASGWALQPHGDCQPRPNRFARVALCSATGEVNGYAVTVNQLGDSRDEATVLTLDVRPLG